MENGRERTNNPEAPQTEHKHPSEWERDLNPNHMAGQNVGDPEAGLRTAYDVKEVHRSLRGFRDDELRKIPVLAEGTRLQQGATYLDLNGEDRSEFTATGSMEAGPDHWYVPKDLVPYSLWNRLLGIDDPERTLRD